MRTIISTVGPLAAASATKISASQSVPGAAGVVIDSATSTGYSATSIATTTGNGAGTTTVTLNGSTVVGGVATLIPPAQVVIVSAGNDSAKTVTVAGLGPDSRTAQSETITAANTSRTSTTKVFSQVFSVTLSAGSAGNISVGTNGTYIMDVPRRVLFTSGASDVGITFTITGTNVSGNAITEVLPGGAVTAASVMDFLTISKIITSGATAGTLTVGTNGVAAGPWIRMDEWAMSQIAIQATISGTVNYTIQSTLDDPNDSTNPVTPYLMTWVNSSDTAAVGAAATIQTNFAYAPRFIRVLLNSGTGSVTTSISQAYSVAL